MAVSTGATYLSRGNHLKTPSGGLSAKPFDKLFERYMPTAGTGTGRQFTVFQRRCKDDGRVGLDPAPYGGKLRPAFSTGNRMEIKPARHPDEQTIGK